MSAESLVIIRGTRIDKHRDYGTQVKEIAELAGVKFIKLHYTTPKFSTTDRTVKGWQAVEISEGTGGDGQKTFRCEFTKNRDGGDGESARNLAFIPKPPTNILEADLLDTPFNRKKLASCFHYGAQWVVVDDGIRADIKAMADEIERQLDEARKRAPTKDDVIVNQADKIKQLEEQLAITNHELKKKAEVDKVVAAAKKEKASVPAQDNKALEDSIKQDVFKENAALIEELKKKTKQWWITKEYRQTIYPEIQRRLAERLKNANDNAGNGVDNKK